MMVREAGILLPVFSLPGPYGIGTFGKEARGFADCLAKAGQRYWQILPLGITGYGDSPYQSFSTFAGNPYFIDLDWLQNIGWLRPEDLPEDCGQEIFIDYEMLYQTRYKVLRKALHRSDIENEPEFARFCNEESWWLEDYALYMAIKNAEGGKSWQLWPDSLKYRDPETLERKRASLHEEILFHKFLQYLFYNQWFELKHYVNGLGIQIIGDIPIYVALDSCDVWAQPELFQLDDQKQPIAVAGCPPDGFSATGQLWGNPLYRWGEHAATGYKWWISRIAAMKKIYDVVRIDHFRGFESYYSIPYGEETAVAGHWEPGPGYALFASVEKTLGTTAVIAEDLGYVTESVRALVDRCGYPGMKIFQFGFDSRDEAGAALYRPDLYPRNSVAYTGTHDNETMMGWFRSIRPAEKQMLLEYLELKDPGEEELLDACLECLMATRSDLVIVPMQDYLAKDNSARINTPSTLGGNWTWRLKEGEFDEKLIRKIRNLTRQHNRTHG